MTEADEPGGARLSSPSPAAPTLLTLQTLQTVSAAFNYSLPAGEEICQELQRSRDKDYGGAREEILDDPGAWAFLIIFLAVSVVGVLGNGLSIFIYATKVKRTPTTAFVIALAAVDLVVCLLVVPQRAASLLVVEVGSDVVCKGSEFLYFLAIPMSCFILLAIAIERFLTICLSKANCLTPTVVRVVLAAIFCASAAIASPSLLMVSVYASVQVVGPPAVSCNMGLCKPTLSYIGQEGGWAYWMFIAAVFTVMAVAILSIYATIFARVMSARSKLSRWKPSRRGAGGSRDGGDDVAAAAAHFAAAAAAAATGTSAAASTTAEQRAPVVDGRAECSGDAQARTETVELSETANGGNSSRSASPTAALAAAAVADAYEAAAAGVGAREGGALLLRDEPDESSTAPLSRTRSHKSAGREPSGASAAGSRGGGCGFCGPGAARPKGKKRSAHLSTAVALCAVTGAFIVAYAPAMVMSLTGGVCNSESPFGKAKDCDWLTWNVLWHFFLLNHVANPIIYAFMNPRFNQALRSMVRRGGGKCAPRD